jgi:hypothetical protein
LEQTPDGFVVHIPTKSGKARVTLQSDGGVQAVLMDGEDQIVDRFVKEK